MILNLWNIYKEAKVIADKKRKEAADIKERKHIAKVFNKRYTHMKEYIPDLPRLPGDGLYGITAKGGYAWMCPDCNKIHLAIGQNVFTGIDYPKCCKYPEGHRLYDY
jgi:ssDNA-binding Zn-finger/Zn-ribbon topoisomerase 1